MVNICFSCINVETVPDPDNSKVVTAKLSIKETQKASTPDYEVFDNLYITLVVTDKNQEEGDGTDSGTSVCLSVCMSVCLSVCLHV